MPTHDIAAGRIAWVGAAIGAVVVLVVIGVFLLLHAWQMPARTDRVGMAGQPLVAGPALQSAPQLDLARERAEKQRMLDGQQPVDAHSGAAPIPVAKAMELLAQRSAASASQPEAGR
jgi:hypothetical protein